ncbi:MAG: hypothetical protein Q8M98_00065 [Candidatus Cloacimonadaceae bacterium]|nr:hypothetical protein [Candidatus Cloacimonadaceae bacterium]
METGAGKLEALKVSFDNLSESIGAGLLPVINAFGAAVMPVLGIGQNFGGEDAKYHFIAIPF